MCDEQKPYIIFARHFDPEIQERQVTNGDEFVWSDEDVNFKNSIRQANRLMVVRDKIKPRFVVDRGFVYDNKLAKFGDRIVTFHGVYAFGLAREYAEFKNKQIEGN